MPRFRKKAEVNVMIVVTIVADVLAAGLLGFFYALFYGDKR